MWKKRLLDKIIRTDFIKHIHATPSPRWLTFLADFIIAAVCGALVFMISPEKTGTSAIYLNYSYIAIIVVYALTNLLTGCYKCIVRFSVIDDMVKSLSMVAIASVVLIIISLSFSALSSSHELLISIPVILIIGTIILCMMMLMRMLVKMLYHRLSAIITRRKPVIVLGSAINSLALANSLKNEINGEFDPKALLSLNKDRQYGNVNGMPVEVFDEATVADVFKKYGADTLIFLQNNLELMRNGFADVFLNANINLKILHQIEEFDTHAGDDSQANISGHVKEIRIEDLLSRPVIHNDNPEIRRRIEGNCVMITGAAGSIGSEIVRQVASFEASEIVLLDQAETPMHDMQLEMEANFPDITIHLYVADVQDRDRLELAFEKYRPAIVYHAAAYKHVPMMERNPTEAIKTNVMGTKNLADLSIKYGVKKFVMVSTDKAVNPTNIMGASKRIAEIYVQSLFFDAQRHGAETRFVTTRFGNVLGSNGSVIPLFRNQIAKGGPITVTDKRIIRYFMTIKEACSLVLEAGCMGNGGEIYIFDMGEPVKIYDLAKRMIQLAGLRPDIDIKIVESGLRPGEKLYEELLNDKETTLPTRNHKIMIAKVRQYDFADISQTIDRLIGLAKKGDVHDMVFAMKEIVPEFVSNNSVFQKIDSEINNK